MRDRWFSKRALLLHLLVIVFFPGCLVAWWWQVNRAMDGNGLSYLYAVEWPIFAGISIYVWWSLIHTDPDTVGAKVQQKMSRDETYRSPQSDTHLERRLDDEDPELARYNDRLAELARSGDTKSWLRR